MSNFSFRVILPLMAIMASITAVSAIEPTGGLFVRVENLSDKPTYIMLEVVIHTNSFGSEKYVSRAGLQDTVPSKDQWLDPGHVSPWMDMTSLNSPPNFGANTTDSRDAGTFIFVTRTKEGDEEQSFVPIAVTVAYQPTEGAIIRRFLSPVKDEPLGLIIKNNLKSADTVSSQKTEEQTNAKSFVWTVAEDAQATLDFVKGLQFPGKKPERIKAEVYQLLMGPPFTKIIFPDVTRTHLEVLEKLGFNTIGHGLDDRDLFARYGLTNRFTGVQLTYLTDQKSFAEDINWTQTEKEIERMAEQWRGAGALPELTNITLGDEPLYPPLEEMRNFGPCNVAFREFLRERKVTPQEILGQQFLQSLQTSSNEFLFVEAEHFQVKEGSKAWEIRNGTADPSDKVDYFGGKYLWCDWFDGLQEMEQSIQVPRKGLYRIWIRHRNLVGKNAFFQVKVSQEDKKPGLIAAQAGIEANEKRAAIPPVTGSFGLGDEKGGPMVWESMDAELNAGEATLTLTKFSGYQPWTERKVDCFLLTTDTAFRPDDALLQKTLQNTTVHDGVAEWQGAPMGQRLDSWVYVRVGTRDDAKTNPKFYYWSCDFRSGELTRVYANIRRLVQKHMGVDIPMTASLCARFISDGAACARGPDLFGLPREGAMTLPECADGFYYLPEAGPQLISFVGDILRGGADSLADQTGQWKGIGYLILGFGSAVIDWMRLETYSVLGRGAKTVDYYVYGPECFAWYDFFQNNLGKVKMVGELTHEIGAMEDMGLAEARPSPSEIALVFSKSTDYQEYAQGSSVMFHELQWLYLALRQLHQQVDIITEDEVANGLLQRRKYKAVYMIATNLPEPAAAGLANWVKAGGVLFYEGGPLQDHLNQPLPALTELFGGEPSSIQYDPQRTDVTSVVRDKEMDRIASNTPGVNLTSKAPPIEATTAAVYLRAPLKLSGASTLAHFVSDNTPAMTLNRYGKGTAILSGALLGCAYMRDSQVGETISKEETEWIAHLSGADMKYFTTYLISQTFSEQARSFIDVPLRLAHVQPVAWVTEPLVEVNPMQVKGGLLILLSDYTRKQQAVDLFVRVDRSVTKVSLLQGEMPAYTMANGVLQIHVPIKLTQAVRVDTE